MTRVFAYGMLMEDGQDAAVLPDYSLEFIEGLATIEPHQGGKVFGALLDADGARLSHFDAMEGVWPVDDPSSMRGLYRRVPVKVDRGEVVWAYMKNGGLFAPPRPGYLSMIHRGYLKHGWPVAALEAAVERARTYSDRTARLYYQDAKP